MIFVILGSQKFQFNRLLKALDDMECEDEIFAQTGYSDYVPRTYKYKNFLDENEFNNKLKKSNIIITHGGVGTILQALKLNKKIIAVARNKNFREHIDNHQKEIVDAFAKDKYLSKCDDLSKLKEVIDITKEATFNKYSSNDNFAIIEDIDNTISDWCKK